MIKYVRTPAYSLALKNKYNKHAIQWNEKMKESCGKLGVIERRSYVRKGAVIVKLLFPFQKSDYWFWLEKDLEVINYKENKNEDQ